MEKRSKIRVAELNPHLICRLCKGYLINPVTITECIHTFCKSCLVRHISLVNKCPSCYTIIHETNPLYNIRLDRTMQDVINKIFPKLEQDEHKRERQFYRSRGLPYPQPVARVSSPSIVKEHKPKVSTSSPNAIKEKKIKAVHVNRLAPKTCKLSVVKQLHQSQDQISLQLERYSEDAELSPLSYTIEPLPKKFIRCSTHVTIGLLTTFIATKLNLESETFIGITHNQTDMDKDFTLKYISENLLHEKERLHPLMLQYRAIHIT